MYDDGPLSTRQQLDALKLERERAKLLADQAKAQQQVNKVALDARQSFAKQDPRRTDVPPVQLEVPTPTRSLTDAERAARESSNNPEAINLKSTAGGLYQMTEAARADARKANPALRDLDYYPLKDSNGNVDPAQMQRSIEAQNSYKDAYEGVIQKQLTSLGVPAETIDQNAINQAWVVGPTGYRNILNAEPGTPLENILSKEAIAKNPNLQNKTAGSFLSDPDPYSRVETKGAGVPIPNAETERLLSRYPAPSDTYSVPPPAQAAPEVSREVLIARQDMLHSTDPKVRAKAKAVLDAANQPMPNPAVDAKAEQIRSLEEIPRPPEAVADSRPIVNEPVPRPSGEMDSGYVNDFTGVLEGETRQRQLSTDESIAAINDRISKLDPNNPLDLKTIQELEAEKLNLYNEAGTRGEISDSNIPPPPVNKEVIEVPKPEKSAEQLDFDERLKAFNEVVPNITEEDLAGAGNAKFKELGNTAKLKKQEVEDAVESAKGQKDPKGWLANALSGIFGGEDSIFSDKELIKFAILAAGGLLTGGSLAGSLKYAGLYALQSADKREAARAASSAEAAKDSRERYQQLRTGVLKDMDSLTPESKSKVTDILNKASASSNPAERIALMESALSVMQKVDKESKPSTPTQGYMYSNGKQIGVTFRYNNGVPEIQTSPGNWIKATGIVESRTDYNADVKSFQEDIASKVQPVLKEKFGKDYDAASHAKKLAVDISLIRSEMPGMQRQQFVKAAEMAIMAATEEAISNNDKGLSEEGLRKAFYGNAIMQQRKSNADMYSFKDENGKIKPVGAKYQSLIGEKYMQRVENTRADNPNYNLGNASDDFEKDYKKLPPETKKKYEAMAKDPKSMASPFVLWLAGF